jgi:hypothetical protein
VVQANPMSAEGSPPILNSVRLGLTLAKVSVVERR